MADAIFILYVDNQQKSKEFYQHVLGQEPVLNEPGMTEFQLNSNTRLGIMPENGIANILNSKTPHPSAGNGIPRCEIYLYVDEPEAFLKRAIYAGGNEISPAQQRNWGNIVAYAADPDGHILAFARQN